MRNVVEVREEGLGLRQSAFEECRQDCNFCPVPYGACQLGAEDAANMGGRPADSHVEVGGPARAYGGREGP